MALHGTGLSLAALAAQWDAAGALTLASSSALAWSTDLYLRRDAANTLAQRNGTNAQAFRVYNTYTDASNYERGLFSWESNILVVGTAIGGTGAARAMRIGPDGANANLNFRAAGVDCWQISGAKHFLAVADNSYDIGAVGASRPRNGYFGGTLSFGTRSAIAAETITGYITITDAGGTSRKLAVVS